MSHRPLVSPATRLVALLLNTTQRASSDRSAPPELEFACAPLVLTETRSIEPDERSFRKTSPAELVSPGTKFDAWLYMATKRPSEVIPQRSLPLKSLPSLPAPSTL